MSQNKKIALGVGVAVFMLLCAICGFTVKALVVPGSAKSACTKTFDILIKESSEEEKKAFEGSRDKVIEECIKSEESRPKAGILREAAYSRCIGGADTFEQVNACYSKLTGE